jgi:hypothetical protein
LNAFFGLVLAVHWREFMVLVNPNQFAVLAHLFAVLHEPEIAVLPYRPSLHGVFSLYR